MFILLSEYPIMNLGMLDYLVPSQTKRSLLALLFTEGRKESVSGLAKLVGVSYSTAYEELRAMEKAGLAKSEYEGNRVLFRADDDNPQVALLRSLLNAASKSPETPSDAVLSNLDRMSGALGGHTSENHPSLTNEETLALALRLARRNATVARVVPVALYKSRNHLNLDQLKQFALKAGEKKALGFFLDLTSELSKSDLFHDFARTLRDRRFHRPESFFLNRPRGKHAKRMESQNTPALAKRWHFRMNMDLQNFRSHFQKFVPERDS
jgi:DNA-binding transcriptional ArsR family regulator